MDRDAFEALVRDALDDVPELFAQYLQNVAIVIEDEPTPELLRSLGMNPRHDTLFSLYRGVPLSQRGAGYGNMLPDTISIFYRPILHACRTPEQIRREIRRTVIHEIGHFFGLDENAIRDLGY